MYFGEDIKLTALENQDIPLIYKLFNDMELRKYLNSTIFMTYEDEVNWVETATQAKNKGHYRLAIRTLENQFIGTAGISTGFSHQRSGTIGIGIIDKSFWGKGHGTDAMRILLAFGFLSLNLHRIELEVHDFNERAIKTYIKVGFREVGRKREAGFVNGQYYDSIVMDILRKEFDNIYNEVDLSKPSVWNITN